MRHLWGRRPVLVGRFDPVTGAWSDSAATEITAPLEREDLTLTTFNIWFNDDTAVTRHDAIADLLAREAPDIMVFQEVRPSALEQFLRHAWIRNAYHRAAVVGPGVGDYGMLLLSRIPVDRVEYRRLPTRMSRGFLRAEFTVNGAPLVVCGVHLDSGKSSSRLRGWQLRRIRSAVRRAGNAVLLGDFNMRDDENGRIAAPFVDVWPALRPQDDGFTEDTAINHMRFDAKQKHRQVRFDRVLLTGPAWTPAEIDLLGTEPVSADQPRVFPSDHFGVRCRLVRSSATVADLGG